MSYTLPTPRAHQTAVFVRVPNTYSAHTRSRIERAVDSLNRTEGDGTIKADIFTVTEGGRILAGLQFDQFSGYDSRIESPDLRQAADEAGYNLNFVIDAPASADEVVEYEDDDDECPCPECVEDKFTDFVEATAGFFASSFPEGSVVVNIFVS